MTTKLVFGEDGDGWGVGRGPGPSQGYDQHQVPSAPLASRLFDLATHMSLSFLFSIIQIINTIYLCFIIKSLFFFLMKTPFVPTHHKCEILRLLLLPWKTPMSVRQTRAFSWACNTFP